MNTDSSFHIPLRDSIIYTMLLCNEGFKRPNQLGKLLIQFHSDDTEFFRAQMNWIAEMQGSYRMAVSFLILTHVNTNDVDHWFISVNGTIGRELSKTWLYLGRSFLPLIIETPFLLHICSFRGRTVANVEETEYCLSTSRESFPEANIVSLNMIPHQYYTVSLHIKYRITPSFITRCSSPYLTLQ